jgi:glycyl-tRNA synthetase beta chain
MERELLIEIGVEEMPAAWLPGLTKQLAEKVEARLRAMRMPPDGPVESYATPRRLAVRVGGMAERQEDLDETITGPPVSAAFNAAGEPTPAALGFARKQGVAFEALERMETAKGTYLAVRKHQRGRSAADALPDVLTGVLRELAFPKQMHWDATLDDGRGEFVFGRPIRWLLFLYGGRVVPYAIGRTALAAGSQVQDVSSGAVTYGHRFLATSGRAGRSIKVRTFDDYRARLSEHFVILDHAERRDRIAREIESKARKLSGRVMLREHAALIDEVADLVEYPGVVAGFFDRAFLDLPQEVLTTTLVHHQHYFPVHAEGGALKEAFLAVVNTQPADERVIARNAERVVAARLRDAKFFWDADRRTPLDQRLDRLHTIVFHKKLGSYRDKAERIERLARAIVTDVFHGAPDQAADAAKAARLAKADLATDMVFEFTELQGTMGGIYARHEGLPERVWKAIYYQYLPIGVEADAPPSRAQLGTAAITWAAVSLADKLDSVVGLLLAGEKVTGSRDPFGLRRQAQGVAKILVDLPSLGITAPVSVGALIREAAAAFGVGRDDSERTSAIDDFMSERLRHLFSVRGFDQHELNAEIPLGFSGDAVAAGKRLDALSRMRSSTQFSALAAAFKRAANILRSAPTVERAGLSDAASTLPPGAQDIDRILFDEIKKLRSRLADDIRSGNFTQAFASAADLRPYIDRFFDEVMVMHEDARLRELRLALLRDFVDGITEHLGDISQIVPQSE